MPSIADTLTRRLGPAPVWVWAGVGIAALVGYEVYRKRQQSNNQNNTTTSADSSNLGTTPVSNLTTQAQPMPIQMGDTFVSTTVNNQPDDGSTPPSAPGQPATPPPPVTTPPKTTTQGPYPPGNYYKLSPAAAANALNSLGYTLYQTGAEAIAWAKAHGQPAPKVSPTGYYALSKSAAQEALKENMPLYQSGAEADKYAATHK